MSYTGTLAISTANCNTTGIAGVGTNNAATSTTADFPTFTLAYQQSPATSWIASFLAVSAGVPCTPTGMTQLVSSGSGPAIAGNDSSGTLNAWSDQTCTVTSSNWISYLVEITGLNPALAYVGQYAIGANQANANNNQPLFTPLVTGSDASGYKIAAAMVYFNTGGGNFEMGVYADISSGCGDGLAHCPNTQVCAETTGQAVSTGFFNSDTNLTTACSAVTLTANTQYWLGVNNNNAAIRNNQLAGGLCNLSMGGIGHIFFSGVTYGTWGTFNPAGANIGQATNCISQYLALNPQ